MDGCIGVYPVMILAIDPGTTQSGWCYFDGKSVHDSGIVANVDLLDQLKWQGYAGTLAIEMVAGYGMAVGKEVFETVRWIGRFQQAWREPEKVLLIYRRDVKLYLCGSMKAKDANIRQALIDKLGPKGTKTNPGPTHGVKSHAWAAVAVAVTAAQRV